MTHLCLVFFVDPISTFGINCRMIKENGKIDSEGPLSSDSEAKEFFSNVHYKTVTDALAMFQNDDLIAAPGSKFRFFSSVGSRTFAGLFNVLSDFYNKLNAFLVLELTHHICG
ncbi:unnamed protein product [Strongylus vulgaris]|uniref:Uncharacterized protein n=1 Tax=Strongylus vulgaris TaxID=40348 RepID=A0A3P7IKJ9_STRVU|nr:unnamed protein product [Strongylus vulgaris]